jgi:hypothetical protein
MLVVRVFPAKHIAEVLGFVGATVSILCTQSGNLLRFRRGQDVSGDQLSSLVDLVVRLNNPWLPLTWAGRGLVELGGGNWLLGITLVALTLTLFAGAFWFALVTAERWYYTGWAGMQVVARKKRSVSTSYPETAPRRTVFSRLEGLLSAPVRGIVQKDFLVLRRDLRNLSQLVTPLIFGVIYALAFLRGSGSSSRAGAEGFMQYVRPLLAYGNVGVAIFVGWNILTRLGGMAFSMEGKNYWMLKASPVRATDLLKAKFLVAYLPTLALGGIFLIVISIVQRTPLVAILFGLVVMSMCLAGMSGILIGFGAAGAQLTWEDPRKMNAGTMGCIGMILTALFVPFSFGLFVGPLLLAPLLGLPEYYGYVAGLVLGISISAFSAILPLWLARKKVEQLGEG